MGGGLEHLKVLVVDGDDASEIPLWLIGAGAEISFARTAAEAATRAAGEPFDAVICRFATLDGDEVAVQRLFSADPQKAAGPVLPAIAIVRFGADPSASSGFAASLAEPVDLETLLETVQRVATSVGARREARSPEVRPNSDVPADAAPAHVASLNVLVVDDTKVVADVLAQIFDVLGHRATVVHSGREAIELLARQANDFDVIFSDISMPDMDGHALAGEIRMLRDRGEVKTRMLVAMSGYSDPEEQARSLRSGFDRHMVKPPEMSDLETLLAEAHGMGNP